MGPEATAAVVGAGVGGAVAFVGQGALAWWSERRRRRAAAQLVFAELTIGMAEMSAALATHDWPNLRSAPRREAWDSMGSALLTKRGVAHVGDLAMAYSALEDVAWLVQRKAVDDDEDYSGLVEQVGRGLVVAGKLAGETEAELRLRLATVGGADRSELIRLRKEVEAARRHEDELRNSD